MKRFERILRSAAQIARAQLLRLRLKVMGLEFFEPNYVYIDRFNAQSVVVDVGCGHVAELSMHLIREYNLRAVGVDPTRKHAPALQGLQHKTNDRFQHLALAVARQNGWLTFHESLQNESGSILSDHTNMIHDETKSYDVESVSLAELVRRVGASPIDFIKLDLEGAEYDLLEAATEDDLSNFKQIFVEFHDHCTHYSIRDTRKVVEHIRGLNFKAFTLDKHNFLFYN